MIPSSLFLLSLSGMILIIILFYQFVYNHSRNITRKKNFGYLFLLSFFVYSFYTITKLITSPAPENYFSNSDYHHIEHLGFSSSGNTLNLAGNTNDVLNENFNGLLQLQKQPNGELYFNAKSFNYPIYEFENLSGTKNIININEIGVPFENTFKIELPGNKIVEYKYEKYEDSVCHKIIINGVENIVKFNKKEINISEPFQELIYNTTVNGLTQEDIELIEESYIVRESFSRPSEYRNLPYGHNTWSKLKSIVGKKPNNSKLYFIPSNNLKSFKITSDLSNTLKTIDCTKRIPLKKGHAYVFGFLGYNDEKPFKVELNKQDRINITYLYPRKYKLNNSTEKEERQFILSSWTGLKNCRLETGYLLESNIPDSSNYNIAHNRQNIISFKSGPGNSKLDIKNLFGDNKWKSTLVDSAYSLKSRVNDLEWLVKITSTKSNHILQLPLILLILLFFSFFILFLFGSLTYIQFYSNLVRRDKNNKWNSIKLFVVFLNILVYILVLIKLFLLWRIATFPPLNITSLMDMSAVNEYSNLSNPTSSVFYLLGFLIALCLAQYILLFKYEKFEFYLDKLSPYKKYLKPISVTESNYLNICFKLFTRNLIFLIIIGIFFKSPLVNLLSTLIIFFENQLFVYNNREKLYSSNIRNEFKWTHVLRGIHLPNFNYIFIIPLAPIFLYLAVFDAGFLFVFVIGILIYKLFSAIFLLFQNTTIHKVIFIKLIVAATLLLVLLVFPAKMAILMFDFFENHYFIAVAFIVLLVSLISIYYYVDTFPLKLRNRRKFEQIKEFIKTEFKKCPSLSLPNIFIYLRMFIPLIIVVITSMLFFIKPVVLSQLNNKNHIRYRAEVIDRNSESISKLSGKTNIKSYSFRSLTQQYQNKWFIEHFINRSYSQVDNDFTLQNHFNIGSDYTIQTRDTIIPRYIIGEHNRFIPFVLALILLIIIAFNFIVFPHAFYLTSGKIITLSLSILFAMMLFVTLTTTNLIPFFGQDFPILPTTSKVALGFPLLIILYSLYIHVSKTDNIVERFNVYFKTGGILFGVILLFVAPLILLLNKKSITKDYSILKTEEVNRMKGEIEVYNNDIDSFYNFNHITYKDVHQFHKDYTSFLKQRIDIEDIFTENFSRKAFQNFDESSDKLNAKSIYYYSNINGRFRLEVNPNFDKINYEDNNKWTGDIISGSSNLKGINIYDYESNKDTLIYFNRINIQTHQLRNFYLTHVPGNLTSNNKGYYILSSIRTVYLNIKQNGNSSAKTNYVRCSSGDQFGKVVVSGAVQWMGIELTENIDSCVVMKNYKINNSRYYYYPLNNDLTWAKNYADYINILLADNNKIKLDSTFDISIDLNLNKNLKNIINNASEGSSIAIVNNMGNIITIADNNKKNLNPNDRKSLQRFYNRIMLRRNSMSEREAFGNYALLNMITGPASSQKPLTYAAVASQLKIDWTSLIYDYNSNVDHSIISDDQLFNYAGINIRHQSRTNIGFLLSSHDKLPLVNYDSYITNSVNMYHSLVCYLGSYEKDSFNTNKFYVNLSNTHNIFPLFIYKGRISTFNTKHRPLFNDCKSLERSFMNQGYVKNFGFEKALANECKSNYEGFALPEKSKIEYKIQSNNYINAIKFTTLGSPKIWRVSPVAMAIAYTKLFTLNNQTNGTFLNYSSNLVPKFVIDSATENLKWNSINDYFNFVKNNVYKPMAHVVTSGTLNYIPLKSNGYFLYAKTGTLNEGEQTNENKLLVLIISKGAVDSFSSIDQLRNNKLWTVYFSLPKGEKELKGTIEQAYNIIINSQAFKNYMRNNEK